MKVNIYQYNTIRGPAKRSGAYTYILETEIQGKTATLTKTDRLEDVTEKEAELTVYLLALSRINKYCDISLVNPSPYFKTCITEYLPKWSANDFKNAKGKEIAHKDLWQRYIEYDKSYFIEVAEMDNTYYNWMKEETEKKNADI